MKQIITVSALTLLTIALIILATFVAIDNIEIGKLKTYSINGLSEQAEITVTAEKNLDEKKVKLKQVQENLKLTLSQYTNTKAEYDNITEEQINMIREAYKEKQYYIEWLWVVLGNYATENNLAFGITEPESSSTGTVKLAVVGTYSNVADFVFEVENDNELTFKLDNMSMKYYGANKITAIFDVLDMTVLKSVLEGENQE